MCILSLCIFSCVDKLFVFFIYCGVILLIEYSIFFFVEKLLYVVILCVEIILVVFTSGEIIITRLSTN